MATLAVSPREALTLCAPLRFTQQSPHPLLPIADIENYTAFAAQTEGAHSIVQVRSPHSYDVFAADVHSSMSFTELCLASGGEPLNLATSHNAAAYWRAAYTRHATNLSWVQGRGAQRGEAWPLRVPLRATWKRAPMRDRAVVVQWGVYARPASQNAQRAARFRARLALRA